MSPKYWEKSVYFYIAGSVGDWDVINISIHFTIAKFMSSFVKGSL